MSDGKGHWCVADALTGLADIRDGKRFVSLYRDRGWEIEIYAPRGHDPQKPHDRDEIYVVMAGRGVFLNGDARRPFGPGDLLFVPAGHIHRFEEFSDDLAVWVIFHDSLAKTD